MNITEGLNHKSKGGEPVIADKSASGIGRALGHSFSYLPLIVPLRPILSIPESEPPPSLLILSTIISELNFGDPVSIEIAPVCIIQHFHLTLFR